MLMALRSSGLHTSSFGVRRRLKPAGRRPRRKGRDCRLSLARVGLTCLAWSLFGRLGSARLGSARLGLAWLGLFVRWTGPNKTLLTWLRRNSQHDGETGTLNPLRLTPAPAVSDFHILVHRSYSQRYPQALRQFSHSVSLTHAQQVREWPAWYCPIPFHVTRKAGYLTLAAWPAVPWLPRNSAAFRRKLTATRRLVWSD